MFDTIPATTGELIAPTTSVVSHDISVVEPVTSKPLTADQRLENLIAARKLWEAEIFRTSNDHLYSILQDCYSLYVKCGTKNAAQALATALDKQAKENGFVLKPSAHTLTKIVKCVFGADRRRASAYSIALRAAHAASVAVIDLPAFIRDKGGVEELRLAKSNALKTSDKAAKAVDYVAATELAVVQTASVTAALDTAKVDQFVVLVAQQGADGALIIKAVVNSKTAIDAALASIYSTHRQCALNTSAEKAVASTSAAGQQAIADAIQSVTQA